VPYDFSRSSLLWRRSKSRLPDSSEILFAKPMDRPLSAARMVAEYGGRGTTSSKALHSILSKIKAATQHPTAATAVVQASALSPERTASSQKKALARAHEIAPRNQNDVLNSMPV
jgi:predicted DNA-binding transcriptional regulator YafY